MSQLHPKHISFSNVIAALMDLIEQCVDDVGTAYHIAFRTLTNMACDVFENPDELKSLIDQAVNAGMNDNRELAESEEVPQDDDEKA